MSDLFLRAGLFLATSFLRDLTLGLGRFARRGGLVLTLTRLDRFFFFTALTVRLAGFLGGSSRFATFFALFFLRGTFL